MDSQAIINTMEVLNTKPLNDLVTEATVKVCWVSDLPNPNQTVITKEVGRQIAETLPGAPVVGLFNKETNDFEEHSTKLVLTKDGFTWEDLTRPYGFVSPIDKPWYEDFIENGVKRTYLMCKAFLWTRQYKEASLIIGKGQSMELHEPDLKGFYEDKVFIFTQATLDRLCILGDEYAPCFSGAGFLSNYAKTYKTMADQLENLIGRRYYVLNDKLVEKPEISLKYALELGWNLNDAIYGQLELRGMSNKYQIIGVFEENGGVFTILQDKNTLEYLKVDVILTNQDTVVLGTDMIAVTLDWATKSAEPQTEPLAEPSVSTAPTMNTQNINTFSAQNAEPSAEPITEPVVEPVTAPTTDPTEPVVEPAEPVVEPTTEPITEPTAEPVTEPAGPAAEPVAAEPTEPTEPTADPAEPAAEPAAEPVEPSAEPATDYALINQELTTRIGTLEAEIATKDARISSLENELNTYKAKQKAEDDKAKNEMVKSYRALLSEDEIKPVVDSLDTLSLDEIESKLAVTYTRKQRTNTNSEGGMQVNINSLGSSDDDLNTPDYFKKALKYDQAHSLTMEI